MLRDFPMFGTSGELAAEVERSVAECPGLEVTLIFECPIFALIGIHILKHLIAEVPRRN
jgi:hypothetical protein